MKSIKCNLTAANGENGLEPSLEGVEDVAVDAQHAVRVVLVEGENGHEAGARLDGEPSWGRTGASWLRWAFNVCMLIFFYTYKVND